jgi:flagellar protein FliO/FliZ
MKGSFVNNFSCLLRPAHRLLPLRIMSAVVNSAAMCLKITLPAKFAAFAPEPSYTSRKHPCGAGAEVQAFPTHFGGFRGLHGIVTLFSMLFCLSVTASVVAQPVNVVSLQNTVTSTTEVNDADKTNTTSMAASKDPASPATSASTELANIDAKPQINTVQTDQITETATAPSKDVNTPTTKAEHIKTPTAPPELGVPPAVSAITTPAISTPANSTPQLRSSAALPPIHEVVIYLALVVFAIVLLASFAKKMQLRLPGGQHFKLVATLPLGPKERLLVIEIQGKQRVLGVTAQQINFLFELELPLESDKVASNFHSQLQSWMNKSTSA